MLVLAPLGIGLTLGAQIVSIVEHFTMKNDLIAQCTANTVGASYTSVRLVYIWI